MEIESGDLLYRNDSFRWGKNSNYAVFFCRFFITNEFPFMECESIGDAMEIVIISGFLGAGKTTLLNKYLSCLTGKTAVIENEFGEIGIDGALIDGETPVKEINAGCICCSLSLDFRQGIREIQETYYPDRIIIEPSGIGRLSDITKACEKADVPVKKRITIVDISSFEDYAEDFGAFYLDQIQYADLILFSNLNKVSAEQKALVVAAIKDINPAAYIFAEDWREADNKLLLDIIRKSESTNTGKELALSGTLPGDRVFSSISVTSLAETEAEQFKKLIKDIQTGKYGQVLRVKGAVPVKGGDMLKIDAAPSYCNIEKAERHLEQGIVLIGCNLEEEKLRELLA